MHMKSSPPFPQDDRIRIAVVTGGHSFEVPQFHRLFAEIPNTDVYIQSRENWSTDDAGVRDEYDVVVFYNMDMFTPTGDEPWPMHRFREAIESLGKVEQGIVVWHHALLSHPDWDIWSDIVGIRERKEFGYYHDQIVNVDIADQHHPITHGMTSFEIHDETYTMSEAGPGNTILLTTTHEKSVRTLAWTREYGQAQVFCLQLGHDAVAWENDRFRTLMQRGILWCSGR